MLVIGTHQLFRRDGHVAQVLGAVLGSVLQHSQLNQGRIDQAACATREEIDDKRSDPARGCW